MVSVVGHWEIGYHAPITEMYYWNLVLRDFDVSKWYMAPVSGVRNNESSVKLTEFNNYDEIFRYIAPGLPRVFLEPRTEHSNPDTIWLHDFKHPEDCVYVFGSAHYNPTKRYKREEDFVVSIKTKQDKGVLWSNQCLAVVLYDRMLKCQ